MTMSRGRWAAVVAIAVIAVLLIGLSLFDWNLLRGFVERRVSAATGREFSIHGKLDVHLGWHSRLRLERVTLGNADWSDKREMFNADLIALRIRLLPLLTGRLVIPEIMLVKPRVLLEANLKGERNWEFKTQQAPSKGPAPVIGALNIKDGVLQFRDPQIGTDLRFALNTQSDPQSTGANLAVRATGKFKGAPFAANGQVGSLLMLRDVEHPYPLDVRGEFDKTRIILRGTLTDPFHVTGADMQLDLAGPDLAKLHPILGLPFPSTPPYTFRGQVRHEGKVWRFANITGKTGNSDIDGDFSVDSSGDKPLLHADLHSRRLVFADLASLVGGTPPPEHASAEQRREAARRERKPTVLPNNPFNLQKLNSVQADVRLRAQRLDSPTFPLDDLALAARLRDGVLKFDSLRFGIASGDLAGTLTLNARQSPIKAHGDFTVRRIQLHRLVPKIKHVARSEGRIGGRIKLEATGNSIAQLAASADGDIALIMTGGQVSNLLAEFAEIDLGRALKLLIGGDKDEAVRCGVADFKVNNGTLDTQHLVVDTEGTKIEGQGSVNLAQETLDLKLQGKPKHASLLAAPSPIYLRGTFKKPDLGVSKSLFARGAAAIALGAVAGPLAALVPLVSTGDAKNSPCAALIADAKADMGAAHPKPK